MRAYMIDEKTQTVVNRGEIAVLKRQAATPIRHLVRFATFLGAGALWHAWQLGPVFNQHSLWSWGYLLAWPMSVLLTYAWVLFAVLAVFLVILFVFWSVDALNDRSVWKSDDHR